MRRVIASLLVVALVEAGGTDWTARASNSSEMPPSVVGSTSLEAVVRLAAQEFGVPPRVLMAVSYVESLWEDHGTAPSFWNGYGIFHLQDNPNNDSLVAAARLLGLSTEVLKSQPADNARGAAALLRSGYLQAYPDDARLARASDIGRWYRPVAAYHRTDKLSAQRNYADSVFAILQRGVTRVVSGSRVDLGPSPLLVVPDRGNLASVPSDQDRVLYWKATGRYRASLPGAKLTAAAPLLSYPQNGADSWFGSPNYTPGFPQQMVGVVVHTCQGDSVSCQATLVNDSVPLADRVSAHWLVYSGNGWREQFVHIEDRSWHCGECPAPAPWYNWNNASVGIEHEGWVTDPSWYSPVMYSRSAWLTAWTCWNRFGCDRAHVVGHSEVQTGSPDPGPYWDWSWYMTCVSERMDFIRYGYPLNYCP